MDVPNPWGLLRSMWRWRMGRARAAFRMGRGEVPGTFPIDSSSTGTTSYVSSTLQNVITSAWHLSNSYTYLTTLCAT